MHLPVTLYYKTYLTEIQVVLEFHLTFRLSSFPLLYTCKIDFHTPKRTFMWSHDEFETSYGSACQPTVQLALFGIHLCWSAKLHSCIIFLKAYIALIHLFKTSSKIKDNTPTRKRSSNLSRLHGKGWKYYAQELSVACIAPQSQESHLKLVWQVLVLCCSKVFPTWVPICFFPFSQRNMSGLESCEKYLKIDYFYSCFANLFLIYMHYCKNSFFIIHSKIFTPRIPFTSLFLSSYFQCLFKKGCWKSLIIAMPYTVQHTYHSRQLLSFAASISKNKCVYHFIHFWKFKLQIYSFNLERAYLFCFLVNVSYS